MSEADFDPAHLKQVLDDQLGIAPITELTRISGGQSNPTYYVTHGARRMVLRKQPNGDILRGAHAIDREYRVMHALGPTHVPVPDVVLFHDDPKALGTPFYVMDRLEGRVFEDCSLPDIEPKDRRAIYLGMADAMAKMHAVDPAQVGLGDYGKPGNYFARQVGRWTKQLHGSTGAPIPELHHLSRWLQDNLPEDDGQSRIAHGDFRLGNLMFHPSEPRVIAILDWELSTLGHPLADLGYCCMTWHTAPEEYGGIRGLDLEALGIPSKDEFVAHFEAQSEAGKLTDFHVIFSLFRFGVIFVGIADRARAGTAAGKNADQLAPLAQALGRRGLELLTD